MCRSLEDQLKLATLVLDLLNKLGGKKDLIDQILLLIKEKTGFEAVGIRLKEGEDYPYYVTSGFESQFVKKERSLCARDKNGKLLRDENGKAVLECMCGNIISRRTDPAFSFFTAGGSFWTNSTTELLATTTDEERQSHTRNRCNKAGYESVALIPLESEGKVVGLLQLNDKRKDRFTLEIIQYFEELGNSIAIALDRKLAREALEQSEQKFRSITENSPDIITMLDCEGKILFINRTISRDKSEVLGASVYDFIPKDYQPQARDCFESVWKTGKESAFTTTYQTENGDQRYYEARVGPLKVGGIVEALVCNTTDVTKRRKAEKGIIATKEFFKSILENIQSGVWVTDRNDVITYTNKGMSKLSGLSAEEVVGTNVLVDFQKKSHRYFKKYYEQAKETGQPVYYDAVPVKSAVAHDSYQSGWLVPLENNNVFSGMICTLWDVTVQKLDEFELHKHREHLEELVGMRTAELTTINTKLKQEIKERKQAEEKLRANEKLLAQAQRIAHLGSWRWDTVTNELTWSDETYRIAGYKPQEFKPQYEDFVKMLYPDDKDMVLAVIDAAFAGKADYNIDHRIVVNNGEMRHCHSQGEVTRDNKGVPTSMIGIMVDITDYKQAEEKLKASEKKLAKAQELAHVGNWEWDMKTDKSTWSDETYRIYGLDKKEEISFERITELVHPDDRDYRKKLVEKWINDRKGFFEFRLIRQDGSLRYITGPVEVFFDEKGSPVRMSGTVQDITERKLAEEAVRRSREQYRVLVDNLPDIIARYDRNFRHSFINYNPNIESISKIAPKAFIGKTTRELGFPKDSCDFWEEKIGLVFEDGKFRKERFTLPIDNGSITYDWRLIPEFGPEGMVETVMTVSRDITEMKQAEENIKKSLAEKEVLLREVHHRVKNNLQIISSLLNMQARITEDQKYGDMFRETKNRVRSMSLIHEKLYRTSNLYSIDMKSYLDDLTKSLSRSYVENMKGKTLNVTVDDIALCMDQAIPCGLVISELISNSLKHAFSKDQVGRINISMRSDNGYVNLTISDNGVGLPKDLNFYNADTLGLQLITSLVEGQLKGKIELIASSTFVIKFKKQGKQETTS